VSGGVGTDMFFSYFMDTFNDRRIIMGDGAYWQKSMTALKKGLFTAECAENAEKN
jgi:hypothetical protein